MAVVKRAISLPKDIDALLTRQSAKWDISRSGSIARIIQEWEATRRAHLTIIHTDRSDRFPPVIDEPEAA